MNNCARLFEIPCIQSEVMPQTRCIRQYFDLWPYSVTLTMIFVMCRTCPHIMLNKCARLFEIPCWHSEVMLHTRYKRQYFDLWPFSVTLTMKQDCQNTCSAHRLGLVNIHAKLYQSPSRGLKDTERTRFVTDRRTDGQGKNNMSPPFTEWGET